MQPNENGSLSGGISIRIYKVRLIPFPTLT